MRLTWKDAVATVLTGGIVTLYAAFLEHAGLPLVSGPRVLAAVAFGAGLAACAVGGSGLGTGVPGRGAAWPLRLANALSALAFAAALVAMITGNHAVLAVLVWTIVALWLLATARHALTRTPASRVEDGDLHRMVEHSRRSG
jgi:hypothetical protein